MPVLSPTRARRAASEAGVIAVSGGEAPIVLAYNRLRRRVSIVASKESGFFSMCTRVIREAITAGHEALGMTLVHEAMRPENGLAIVSPDAISNSGLEAVLAEHGSWHWDNPASPVTECWIAEQDCASLVGGLAAGGLMSVAFLCEGFVWRMLDSIRESICFPDLPAVIIGTSGGLGDSLGPMVQSDSCFSALVDMPNLDCLEAGDANEVRLLFTEALRQARRLIDGSTILIAEDMATLRTTLSRRGANHLPADYVAVRPSR